MKLVRVDLRFFRSFNFDFERKYRESTDAAPWEESSPAWYPFVRVDLEPDVTAVVGANESGKSQLLDAIRAALTGEPIERADFCRYSELYSVQSGAVRRPEFGAILRLDDGEAPILGIPALAEVRSFGFYRPGGGVPFLVVDEAKIPLTAEELTLLQGRLPRPHILKTDLAIPDSVSIAELSGIPRRALNDRRKRMRFLTSAFEGGDESRLTKLITSALKPSVDEASELAEQKRLAEFELARKLLVNVAKIDPAEFMELATAIEEGREGQVEAITGAMNTAIRENLNFQRWWTQDRDFDLLVEAREHELAFTIRDRTNSTYSFGERSQGLRYFLSYFVQLSAHRMSRTDADILLLDEPDAFLSSVGQQDLLRVLQEYAIPEDGADRSQVVYVTHSPFLIDKNAPRRIRVLDKGAEDAGTRVVRDAANNRYEPLRSALGQAVSETAFIGGANLFVEGAGDQTLLSSAASALARRATSGIAPLDLNSVTIVACGGADAIPYMVYLARGRDSIKPPCVALLDGDKAGRDAKRLLQRGEARKKRILADDCIVVLDEWFASANIKAEEGVTVEEIEDLIPIFLARHAALNYVARFRELDPKIVLDFSSGLIADSIAGAGGRVWDGLCVAFRSIFPGEKIEKAGFAREVSGVLDAHADSPGVEVFLQRFEPLLQHLADRLDTAVAEEMHRRADNRLNRAIGNFQRDYLRGMRKVDASRLLREIDSALGDSDHTDDLRSRLPRLRREYGIDDLTTPNMPSFERFRDEIRSLGEGDRLAFQDDAVVDPLGEVEAGDRR